MCARETIGAGWKLGFQLIQDVVPNQPVVERDALRLRVASGSSGGNCGSSEVLRHGWAQWGHSGLGRDLSIDGRTAVLVSIRDAVWVTGIWKVAQLSLGGG